MRQRSILIIVGVVSAIVILIVAITLGVILSNKDKSTPLDEYISENAVFPNGSFSVSVASLQHGPTEMSPRQLNATTLLELGIRVDDSSLIAETGRLSYFYIWIPAVPRPSERRKSTSSMLKELGENATPRESATPSIGIRFGVASSLNVVPLSLAAKPLSGLKRLRVEADRSEIYELQVRMPKSMGASRGACTMISWQSYWISSDSKSGVSSDASTELPVASGSQCDAAEGSPCASSSCLDCDAGGQVAGADTPITRRYNMGTTQASVGFAYETFTVKDRITVEYEGATIFDTGCVGARDVVTLTFAGSSKELRVDVEPNCAGSSGTQWNFQLSCPSPCVGGSGAVNGEPSIVLRNTVSKEVTQGATVLITKDAEMPPLTAYYCSGDGANPGSVTWTFTIEKEGPICTTAINLPGYNNPWNIVQSMPTGLVQGGNAVLSWEDAKMRKGSLGFKILGTQPTPKAVYKYINSNTTLWYAEYVAKAESKGRQFDSKGYPFMEINPGPYGTGYGIFQLTKEPTPTCVELWSWKKNVEAGVAKLKKKATVAQVWMNSNSASKPGQRVQARQDTGDDVPVPKHTEANCVFEDNTTRVIEDAVALKAYNGATLHYCVWNNAAKAWNFNPTNEQGRNYVNHVCQGVPLNYSP